MIPTGSPRHKGILGYPLPLTLAPCSLKLWIPGCWLRPAGAAQAGGVLIFSVFEHLTTEFSFHYMECLSHWLRSHLTTILCIVGFDRPRGGCKWGVMFRQAGQAGPDCGAGKLEQCQEPSKAKLEVSPPLARCPSPQPSWAHPWPEALLCVCGGGGGHIPFLPGSQVPKFCLCLLGALLPLMPGPAVLYPHRRPLPSCAGHMGTGGPELRGPVSPQTSSPWGTAAPGTADEQG